MSQPSPRRTKIVATLGPGSTQPETLRALIAAGVDVVRINSSHGDPKEWSQWIGRARDVARALNRHIGVLVDLQGPRIRVGALAEPRPLRDGDRVTLAPEDVAADADIPTTYEELADDVELDSRILIDDGIIVARVERVDGRRVHAVVEHGGLLKSQKGINLPGVHVSAPAVTDRDREMAAIAVEHEVDFLALSFVRRASDVEEIRAIVPSTVRIVAKIERAEAISDIQRILEASDALMVARGDLGVELPFEEVPLAQKRLIGMANRFASPVITATQMLESMIQNPRPTRAEASDVANAILDGTDAVMLSAETAVGRYPVKAVEAMDRIIRQIEQSFADAPLARRRGTAPGDVTVDDAIAHATSVAAQQLRVPVIVCLTKSGFTARKISAHRPVAPIVGLSTETETCGYLSLVWGVVPLLADERPTYEAMVGHAREVLVERGLVRTGDLIAVTAGVPFEVPGTTNLLKVEVV
jgi:pyruvate kinase